MRPERYAREDAQAGREWLDAPAHDGPGDIATRSDRTLRPLIGICASALRKVMPAAGLQVGVLRFRGKGDAKGRAWIDVDIGKDFHRALAIDETGREMLSR